MATDRFGKKFDRLYVAVLTPMKEDYTVHEPAPRKLLQYFMKPKFVEAAGAIIINPEAGELFALRRQEKRRNVEITLEECGGKVPIFAGVIDINTEDSVKVAIDADEQAHKIVSFPFLILQIPPLKADHSEKNLQ